MSVARQTSLKESKGHDKRCCVAQLGIMVGPQARCFKVWCVSKKGLLLGFQLALNNNTYSNLSFITWYFWYRSFTITDIRLQHTYIEEYMVSIQCYSL